MASKGIRRTFNPPYSLHFGGVFEIMINIAKRAVIAMLGNADITDEKLMTAFIESWSFNQLQTIDIPKSEYDIPLTPNHLLHGQIGGMFASEGTMEIA